MTKDRGTLVSLEKKVKVTKYISRKLEAEVLTWTGTEFTILLRDDSQRVLELHMTPAEFEVFSVEILELMSKAKERYDI